VLASFFVGHRLKQIPARRKKLLVVLRWLAGRFQPGRRYSEREVNELLGSHHPDFATLRRLLVDYGYLDRDHGIYRRTEGVEDGEREALDLPERAKLPEARTGDLEETRPQSTWYAMLFPTVDESTKLAARLGALATLTGGQVDPSVHVTVGYFVGEADPAAVVGLARGLDRPAITVRAAGLFSWSEEKDPVSGYTLSLQVIRDDAIREWQRRAIGTLAGAGLAPTFPWEDQNPHLTVLRELPAPPAEVLVKLGSQDFSLEFLAARLVISQRVDGQFVSWLDQPLLQGGEGG
jgi:hypothetical protein